MHTSNLKYTLIVVNGLKHAKTYDSSASIEPIFINPAIHCSTDVFHFIAVNIPKRSMMLLALILWIRGQGSRHWGRSGSRWRCGWCCSGSSRCCCTWWSPVRLCPRPPAPGPPSRRWPGNLQTCHTASCDCHFPSPASDTPRCDRTNTVRIADNPSSASYLNSKWDIVEMCFAFRKVKTFQDVEVVYNNTMLNRNTEIW